MTTISSALGFIGGGNMAKAIIRGGLEARVLNPARLGILEPDSAKHEFFKQCGAFVTSDPEAFGSWVRNADGTSETQVVLAVKPQMLASVKEQLAGQLDRGRVIITILAGMPSSRVRDALGQQHRVIRAMPNTPASIRRGATAIAIGSGAMPGDDTVAASLFAAVGTVARIDESLMDAFTAVCSSGPAYVFYLAEALTAAAQAVGFDAGTAAKLVRSTIDGAAALLVTASESPAQLRAAVTSKGGTTAAAIEVIERAELRETMIRAITAARDRGAELAKL